MKNKAMSKKVLMNLMTPLAVIALLLSSCEEIPSTGIIKNTSNGVTTTYTDLKPEGAVLIMNGEEINHNQIPLGEEFQLINTGVDGFKSQGNMVKFGSELIISKKDGQVLLHAEDLLSDVDGFHKDSVNFLRCYISTGSPMEYDQKYDVQVRFWDKIGDGEIVNKLEIEIIDIP